MSRGGRRIPRQFRETQCVECGRAFMAYRRGILACSDACTMRRWRAYSMLAGTHGFVKGRFQRLVNATD